MPGVVVVDDTGVDKPGVVVVDVTGVDMPGVVVVDVTGTDVTGVDVPAPLPEPPARAPAKEAPQTAVAAAKRTATSFI